MEGGRPEHDDPINNIRHLQCQLPGVDSAKTLSDQGNRCGMFIREILDPFANLANQGVQLLAPAHSLRPEIAAETPAFSFKPVILQIAV
jgi:hypothetical protein